MSLDVVVIGGGIVGLTVAWRAAVAGMEVTVCDPAPGHGASWAAAGMLAPITEAQAAEGPLARLGLASLDRWPAFAADLAADAGTTVDELGLRCHGTLQVAFDEDDRRALDELRQVHELLGLSSEPCTARRCRELEPLLSPSVRGGLYVETDWQVDPRRVVDALARALVRRGGRLLLHSVGRLLVGDGSEPPTCPTVPGAARGVELDDGSVVAADSVVLATGVSVSLPGLSAAAVPPVRPVKGEILRLQSADPSMLPSRTVRGSVRGRPVYLVPRSSGELVVGATMQEAGFDTSVRAGAIADLLEAAIDLVPAVAEFSVTECIARLRPATPDNAPVLGPAPVPGLHLATGHHRNGVLLAPVTGDALVASLCTGTLPDRFAAFGMERLS